MTTIQLNKTKQSIMSKLLNYLYHYTKSLMGITLMFMGVFIAVLWLTPNVDKYLRVIMTVIVLIAMYGLGCENHHYVKEKLKNNG